ncbi:MAG: endolytic transglycosylase MltG, partial [Prevotellaceae bacterium]|nr:endolytic transglycosylase MltG [Prevotellaceae bacterium]
MKIIRKYIPLFKKNRIAILSGCCVLLLIGALQGYRYYHTNYASNVSLPDKAVYLYVRAGADFNEVLDSLRSLQVLKNESTFVDVAGRKNYPENIHSGRYKLADGMSNKQLVQALMLGMQEPVRLTLSGNIRTNRRLAVLLSRNIQPDSLDILRALEDTQRTREYGFTPATIMGMFIP